MALTQGMLVLQSELSVLLVGFMLAPSEAGLFRIANVTATAAAAAMPIVIHVAFPVFARLHAEKDYDRLQKSVTFFACIQLGGILLLAAPLLIVPKLLLGFAFGTGFAAASTPLRLLLIGQIFSAAFGPNVVLLNMTHQEQRVTRAMGIALALNVVLVPLLTYFFGVEGAAIGLVVSTFCWNVIAWTDARRLLGIETSAIGAAAIARRAA
jgi:O-antigen/teichoic acid export membrane protein